MEETNCEKNCSLLFDYMKSILYDGQVQPMDLGSLDGPFRKLGEGMEYLRKEVEEMRAYASELSKGNLSGGYPSRDNFLCADLKNLHANLNHLTWQAKQVAAGDYSQHVSYLGEFSEAFNTMIGQLKERESLLTEEAKRAQERAKVIEEYNGLLLDMTRKRNEWILVIDAESRNIVYCNKRTDEELADAKLCNACRYRLGFRSQILNWQDSTPYKVWETGDEENGFFHITTFHIEWRGRAAYAHIVQDITDNKRATVKLTSIAYRDLATGLNNRPFFEEYMSKLISERAMFTLCYMDLDGLKYVNDNFGHSEGDAYLRDFVSEIRQNLQDTDVFARIGGDEFCILLMDVEKEAAEQKFAGILKRYTEEKGKVYPTSFSYGIVAVDGEKNELTLEEILKLADTEMYKCKKKNKETKIG